MLLLLRLLTVDLLADMRRSYIYILNNAHRTAMLYAISSSSGGRSLLLLFNLCVPTCSLQEAAAAASSGSAGDACDTSGGDSPGITPMTPKTPENPSSLRRVLEQRRQLVMQLFAEEGKRHYFRKPSSSKSYFFCRSICMWIIQT